MEKELGTVEARQGNRKKLNLRVLVMSMGLVVLLALLGLLLF